MNRGFFGNWWVFSRILWFSFLFAFDRTQALEVSWKTFHCEIDTSGATAASTWLIIPIYCEQILLSIAITSPLFHDLAIDQLATDTCNQPTQHIYVIKLWQLLFGIEIEIAMFAVTIATTAITTAITE